MRPLILALNPSIDAEWRVARVQWEEKNPVLSERRWPGGKGVNVARWLRFLGAQPRLLLPLGGPTGAELKAQLRHENITAQIIPVREPTRVNVIVTPIVGRQLRFNPAGPKLSAAEWIRIFQSVERRLKQTSLLILSGSLPREAPTNTYARLVRCARRSNVRTLLDCDGAAFAAGVKAGPFLVKPNEHELAQWHGRSLRSEAAVRHAAQALSRATGGWVLVSRGAKGALLVNVAQGFVESARSAPLRPVNTVGAGDALLAAVVGQVERGSSPAEWLRCGVAAGAAATQCAAGQTGTIPRSRRPVAARL